MSRLNQTGRGSLSVVLACCALVLALALAASAGFADTSCGPPESLPGSCFQAGDGDQLEGDGDLIDWQSFMGLEPTVDLARGVDSKFAGGSKELAPGAWEFVAGNNTPKTDLLEGWGRLGDDGFLYTAFTRVKQEGDTYLAFELNQLPAGPRESGGIPVPSRSAGDVLITYDISTTNRISVGMCIWDGDSSAGMWDRLDGTPVEPSVKTCTQLDPTTIPSAMGAVNFGQPISPDDNYLQDHEAGIGAGQFGEALVNLNALPEGAGRFLTNPCGPNGWLWMHSRASLTVTSQPKDILAGAPLNNPSCHLSLDKKVSLTGVDGTFVDASESDPLVANVGDTVTYSIAVTNTGTAPLSIDVEDARCDGGTLSGNGGRDGSGDSLAAGETATYTCTHQVTADDDDPLVNTACATGMAGDTTIEDHPCDSAVVDVVQPSQEAAVAGVKIQDSDGDGVHDDGEGPLSGFLFWVDYDGNGALDTGEPAAVSGADGSWQISGVAPGTWQVREASDPNFSCTSPSPCVRELTLTGGETTDAGEWLNKPVAYQLPEQTEPGQVVLGERIAPGRARLIGPTGCRAKTFRVRVAGTKITRVVFILDGRKVKTLKRTNFRTSFALRINPKRLSIGVHRLVAQVSFQRGSRTKPRSFRLSFQRCPRALRAPRFTG
jgi:hypothetical protein